jgi:hypothetical protein
LAAPHRPTARRQLSSATRSIAGTGVDRAATSIITYTVSAQPT